MHICVIVYIWTSLSGNFYSLINLLVISPFSLLNVHLPGHLFLPLTSVLQSIASLHSVNMSYRARYYYCCACTVSVKSCLDLFVM